MSQSAASETQTYKVAGMTCLHCVRSVTEELDALDGVTDVDVNLEDGVVQIRGVNLPDADEVKIAVEEAGYELVQ